LAEEETEIVTGIGDPDCNTTWLDETGLVPLKQPELEVMSHVTASTPAGKNVKKGELMPAGEPFTFH
jgi:hypothetical protein